MSAGPRLGLHVSISGTLDLAVDRAAERDCDAFQVFSASPRTWRTRLIDQPEIELFKNKRRAAGLGPVVFHAPYLVNLCSVNEATRTRSLEKMIEGAVLADRAGAEFFSFHVGSFGDGERASAVRQVAEALKIILDATKKVRVLLENSAGGGAGLGVTFGELGEIIERAEAGARLGVCFDTAHAFGAGYDLRDRKAVQKTILEFDRILGLDRLAVIHANDSKFGLGTRRDRHEHIGKGYIGLNGFRALVNEERIGDRAFILETPGQIEDDQRNIRTIRSLVG